MCVRKRETHKLKNHFCNDCGMENFKKIVFEIYQEKYSFYCKILMFAKKSFFTESEQVQIGNLMNMI